MSLNPKYVVAPSLQMYFVDKNTGFPLAQGKVFFYRDTNRTEPKAVYELQGNQANYTYAPLPNPIILSNVGTIQDNTGADVLPYYYPYDQFGNEDLYYIVVQDSNGAEQFVRQAWPNPTIEENATSNNLFNYIPNGQLLAHTNLPDDLCVAGSNPIAQGGVSIELDNSITSVNKLIFIPQQYTLQPPQSPRYIANFTCTTANSLEVTKSIRVKFNDVNKFSTIAQDNTYAIWMVGTTSIPVTVNVYKFFGTGGSPAVLLTQASTTITTSPTFFNFLIDFELNQGENVGPDNDDYVAIDISFPTGITFDMSFSDMVLVDGNVPILNFPVQTNADMFTRGIFGWVNAPDPRGYDLYLPAILTREGMIWDSSVIGRIEFVSGAVVSPNSVSPLPVTNDMPFASGSYIYNDYSAIGIPFARLGDYLIAQSPVVGIPLYGTGDDFATAYELAGVTDSFRLTVNMDGVGIPAASDGNTGWTFTGIVDYNGSTTGSASIGYTAYSNASDTVLCVGTWGTVNFNSAPTAGTTPFTVTINDFFLGYTAQQQRSFTVLCTAASTIVAGSGNPGDYWLFSNNTTNYYMWFYFNGETDPAPGSRTGIKVTMNVNYTAQDVANIVREVMNAYQISTVTVTTVPLAGQYWLFSTNPSSVANYYVWYSINGAGIDPLIGGRIGINVALVSGETDDTVATKTRLAVDKYQYDSPPQPGMFLRGIDFNGVWDEDVANRWSSVSGISGAMLGTFEYSQFLSHDHDYREIQTTPGTGIISQSTGSDFNFPLEVTNNTGGNETRPVNMYASFVIKY